MRVVFALTCMFLIGIVNFSIAQDTQVKVRVFDGTTPEEEETKKQNIHNDKNFISINPYLLGRGAFTIGYERALHEKHSLSIDIGLTYRDYVYELVTNDDFYVSDDNATARVGRYLQVAYKFYPKGVDDFDGGFYFSPQAILRNYNVSEDIEEFIGTTYVTTTVDRSYSMKEFALKFGYCTESWLFDDMISDVYFGIGSREVKSMQSEDYANPTLVTEVIERRPAVYFGVKFGFVF